MEKDSRQFCKEMANFGTFAQVKGSTICWEKMLLELQLAIVYSSLYFQPKVTNPSLFTVIIWPVPIKGNWRLWALRYRLWLISRNQNWARLKSLKWDPKTGKKGHILFSGQSLSGIQLINFLACVPFNFFLR